MLRKPKDTHREKLIVKVITISLKNRLKKHI